MWKYGVIAALVAIISGYIYYQYNSLTKQIKELNTQLDDKIIENNMLQLKNALVEKDITILKNTVSEQNKAIENMKIQKVNLEQLYSDYKKKTTAEIFKNNQQLSELLKEQNKSTCEYGEKLNKAIGEIDYKDL